MTGEIGDERLNAYIDGELHGEELARMEQDLASDSQLRDRVERLRQVDRTLASAFDHPDLATIPAHLLATLEAPPKTNVVQFFPRKSAFWQLPIAAGFALAIGVAGGFQVGRSTPDAAPSVIATLAQGVGDHDPLHTLLESTPSATQRTLANVAFEPILTFEAADGRYCREFELSAQDEASVGVACRTDEGWHIEVLTATAAIGDQGYAPVNGPSAILDRTLTRIGAKAPLSAEAEAELMRKGWR